MTYDSKPKMGGVQSMRLCADQQQGGTRRSDFLASYEPSNSSPIVRSSHLPTALSVRPFSQSPKVESSKSIPHFDWENRAISSPVKEAASR